MEAQARREAHMVAEDLTSEYRAYKKLLLDIAAELESEDIKKLAFYHNIRSSHDVSAVDLLEKLDRYGKIGQFKIASLSRMLDDIKRNDLVTSKIAPYLQKYPARQGERHQSESTLNQISHSSMSLEKRASTLPVCGSTENIIHSITSSNSSSLIQLETQEQNHIQEPVISTPLTGRFTPASTSSHYSSQSTSDHMFHPYDSSSSGSGIMGIGVAPHQPRKQRSLTTSFSDLSIRAGSSEPKMHGYLHNNILLSSSQNTQDDIPVNPSQLHHKGGYYATFDNSLPRSVVPQGFQYVLMPVNMIQLPIQSNTPPVLLQSEEPLCSQLASAAEQLSSLAPTHETRTKVTEPALNTSHLSEFSSKASPGTLASSTSPIIATSLAESAFTATVSTIRALSQASRHSRTSSLAEFSQSSRSSRRNSQSHGKLSDLSVSGEHHLKQKGGDAECQQKLSSAMVEAHPTQGGVVRSLKRKLHCQCKHKTDKLKWSLDRSKLNKVIYKHEEMRTFQCKKKLQVDICNGSSLNPQLTLILYPYGLERDKERSATLVVHISASKKAPPLKEPTKVVLLLQVSEGDGKKELLYTNCREINLNLRVFRWYDVVTHEDLRKSKSNTINFEVQIVKED